MELKKKFNLYFLLKFSFKYIIMLYDPNFFITSFMFLSLPSDFIPFFYPSKKILARSSPSTVTKIFNTHSQSQHSPLLLFYQHQFSYIICSKSEHFHQFPNSHDRRQLTVIIFSDCDQKYNWNINVRDHY